MMLFVGNLIFGFGCTSDIR